MPLLRIASLLAMLVSAGCRGPESASQARVDPVRVSSTAPTVSSTALAADTAVRDQNDCPEGMLFIPAGTFSMTAPVPGNADKTPLPQTFQLEAFCIDRTEVPYNDYERQRDKCGKANPDCQMDASLSGPATCITHVQAECYCAKGTSVPKRLPTSPEWLYAALGSDGRKYPWGNDSYPEGLRDPTDDFCPSQSRVRTRDQMCPVDQNGRDRSPFGVIGMATNGLEMTDTCYASRRGTDVCLVRGTDPGTPLMALTFDLLRVGIGGRGVKPNIGFRCATSERVQP